MTKIRMKIQSESSIQIQYFQWINLYPKIRGVTYANPNGGSRHPAEAVNLKRQGVTAGVPDIFCGIASSGYHGLYIELKREGGKVSDIQRERIKLLQDEGYAVHVCYGFDDAVRVTKEYLKERLK